MAGHQQAPSQTASPKPDSLQSAQEVIEPKLAGEKSQKEQGVFPPPDPGPPHERSAHEGDGKWIGFFEGAEEPGEKSRVSQAPPEAFEFDSVRRMVIHPHRASRFQKMTIAAFDLHRFRVHHSPGKKDVQDLHRDDLADRAGLIPRAAQAELFAVFNGGFQPRHGRWGMLSLGEQLIVPRHDACTVALFKSGRMTIRSWPMIEAGEERPVAYRQTPPCLIESGELHPRLKRGDRSSWGGQVASRRTRRRSGLGVSQDGRTLFVAVGQETEPETLAAGLLHVGAFHGAQLDINWNWTRLFLFAKFDGQVISIAALEEDMAKDIGEYVRRPAGRGFFYLTLRDD